MCYFFFFFYTSLGARWIELFGRWIKRRIYEILARGKRIGARVGKFIFIFLRERRISG